MQEINLQTQTFCQPTVSGSSSSQAFLIQKFSSVTSEWAHLGGVLESGPWLGTFLWESVFVFPTSVACTCTHAGLSWTLARRCQESTFCNMSDQMPGRGSLCHDADREDESSILHVAFLGFWKMWGSPGTRKPCLSARSQVTVWTSVILGKHHGVCSRASLQSTASTRRKSSFFCFHCTSKRRFSSFDRRRCCHPRSGTGRRRCFPEGRSWKGTRPHWVGSQPPPGHLAVCEWAARGQRKGQKRGT